MPPSQDPTSPNTGDTPSLDLDNLPVRHVRLMKWIYRTGIALLVTGFCIVLWNLSESALSSAWTKVGFLLVALSSFIIFSSDYSAGLAEQV